MPYKFNPFTGKLDNAPGAPVFNDEKFTIFDDGNKTKRFQFEASAISPSTTRTLNIQDVSGPVAVGFGTAAQYIRGDATIANFPVNVGGGSSVNYYLNGSVNQGVFGGNTYYEMNRTPVIGAGTNFSINAGTPNAYFITDANDPALLSIPQGNWTFQFYASTSGGNPHISIELYKYDGVNFTQIGATSPIEHITTAAADIYFCTLSVPLTAIAITDRLAIKVIGGNLAGHTVTLYTEGNKLAEIVTTFSSGIAALNGLTDQIQFFSTGTTGTNFNIVSSAATHTFNIPVVSGTNTGKLSATDWTTFNSKIGAGLYTATSGLTLNTARILGRTTAGVGAAEEISIGTGLSLTGGVLSNSAAGVTSVTATAPITSSGGATPNISTSMATNKLIGRTTAGTGVMEEISTAGTLTLTGGTLTGTGIGGTLGTVDNAVPRADGTGGATLQNSAIVIDDATTSTQANVAIVNNHSETNSSLVLSPKGTGAFILGPKPDGTATGGNARGTRAVDLQLSRANNTEVVTTTNGFAAGLNNTVSGVGGSAAIGSGNTSSGSSFPSFAAGASCQATGISAIALGRNCSAGNYSISAGGFSNASGDGSVALGNTALAQGINSQAFGQSCTANAIYSTAIGEYALANRRGMVANSAGSFSGTASGDAQRARFVLRCKTTTNTGVEMALDGSTTYLTIPAGKVMFMNIKVTGSKSDGSAVATYERQYAVKHISATATSSEIYAPITIGSDFAAGTSLAVSVVDQAGSANDYISIKPTGITGETWRWVASVDAVEVAYGT